VLISVYGKEKIESERPFTATLENGVWTVEELCTARGQRRRYDGLRRWRCGSEAVEAGRTNRENHPLQVTNLVARQLFKYPRVTNYGSRAKECLSPCFRQLTETSLLNNLEVNRLRVNIFEQGREFQRRRQLTPQFIRKPRWTTTPLTRVQSCIGISIQLVKFYLFWLPT
jgi:hypothetical protein